MSGRRPRDRDQSPTLEPIIIERRPEVRSSQLPRSPSPPRRRRSLTFLFKNPFRRRTTIRVVKESTIRPRRNRRRSRSRTPSPSPSLPRGPDNVMDTTRIGKTYTPLPQELPKDGKESRTERQEEKKPARRRSVKIIHGPHPEDQSAYPRVESPSPRRDSGIYSIEGSPAARQYYDASGRPTYPPSQDRVQDMTDHFNALLVKERLEKIEAEKAAVRAKAEAQEAKAEVERMKRQSWLEERERSVEKREKQAREEKQAARERESPGPSRPPRDVVLIQPGVPVRYADPVRYSTDPADDALRRAREDFKRRSGRQS